MITCPACGKENEDTALECKRCRAPFREEEIPVEQEPPPDITPPVAFTPPSQVPETLSQELRALAISEEEAAEAGLTTAGNGSPAGDTPPDPFAGLPASPTTGRARITAPAAAAGAALTATAAQPRRPPPAPPASVRPQRGDAPSPAARPVEKPCANCGALNPPAAKFCFDCGTPFAKKTPASAPPPSIQIADDLAVESSDETVESAPVPSEPEPAPAEATEPEAEEPAPEPLPEEQPPPFAARLVLETGNGAAAEFALAHLENSIGGSAAHVGLGDDAYVAPHAATLAFVEERLLLRDEGSVNGVYVKVRESAALQPGDLFLAGERLLRYDGPVELPPPVAGDPPFLGAPRAQGLVVRVTEVLLGAKTGRTCHRAGAISIGRTGCDMNFAADSLLAAKHAEVRVGEDGAAMLVDLGQAPGGVFLRVRAQEPVELQAGDVLRVGEQRLRVEVG